MGCGISSSCAQSTSTQVANSNITQQFSGSCKITCQNIMDNVSAQIFNSSVRGGVNITQTCSVNGQCMIGNNSTAVSDILFKAANSATAGNTFPFIGAGNSKNSTYQEINQNVQEYSTEKCDVGSINSMSNVDVYAANSSIEGGINIGQNGATNGNCALTNVMNATAQATGLSDNCAAAGKASKKKACSGKVGFGSLIMYGIAGLIIFVIVMMIVKFMKGGDPLPCEKPDGTFLPQGPCKKKDGSLVPAGVKYTREVATTKPAPLVQNKKEDSYPLPEDYYPEYEDPGFQRNTEMYDRRGDIEMEVY